MIKMNSICHTGCSWSIAHANRIWLRVIRKMLGIREITGKIILFPVVIMQWLSESTLPKVVPKRMCRKQGRWKKRKGWHFKITVKSIRDNCPNKKSIHLTFPTSSLTKASSSSLLLTDIANRLFQSMALQMRIKPLASFHIGLDSRSVRNIKQKTNRPFIWASHSKKFSISTPNHVSLLS